MIPRVGYLKYKKWNIRTVNSEIGIKLVSQFIFTSVFLAWKLMDRYPTQTDIKIDEIVTRSKVSFTIKDNFFSYRLNKIQRNQTIT